MTYDDVQHLEAQAWDAWSRGDLPVPRTSDPRESFRVGFMFGAMAAQRAEPTPPNARDFEPNAPGWRSKL